MERSGYLPAVARGRTAMPASDLSVEAVHASDLSLKRLEYFLAVAAFAHFGRAAEQVRITQPVLSRQIALLERELGVRLFERTTRGAVLTPAGRALMPDARTTLQAAAALRRNALRAAGGIERLSIGFMAGLRVSALVQGLRELRPSLEIELVRTECDGLVDAVLEGTVDLGLFRDPAPADGLIVDPLVSEPRLAVLPAGHPLAALPEVTLDELVDLDLLHAPGSVPGWQEARRRRGLPPAVRTGSSDDLEVKFELVAAGLGVAVLPASMARLHTHPGVVQRRVAGLAESEVALVRMPHRDSAPIAAAVRLAHAFRASILSEEVLDAEPVGARS